MNDELRPSLLAAGDIIGKIMGTVALFMLPVVIPALILGEPAAAGAVFAFGQAFSLYPALIAAFFPAVQLAFTRYVIEDDGIRIRTSFLQRTERRVAWEKVTAIRHRKTWWDVLVGLERLDVIAYGERGTTLHLVGLRNVGPIRDMIARKMREAATLDALFRGD